MLLCAHPSPNTERHRFNRFWATVCKTVRPMLSVRCLSVCLSVTFVHCGQTVRRIKTKLGMQVGLGPGHIVLDGVHGDPAPPPPKGHSPQFSAHLLRSNGCSLHGSRLSLGMEIGLVQATLCQMGTQDPFPKRGRSPLPNFWPISIVAKRLDGSRCHLVGR